MDTLLNEALAWTSQVGRSSSTIGAAIAPAVA
jgi:hypothetical protein